MNFNQIITYIFICKVKIRPFHSWGNDYCAPKSAVSELPVSTETPQVNFPTETQQPAYNISNVMEWPYELKQLVLQQMDDGLPGFKSTIQMDQSLRFDTVMKKVLSLTDLDGNGKLSAEETELTVCLDL